jgi:hypothetical protein
LLPSGSPTVILTMRAAAEFVTEKGARAVTVVDAAAKPCVSMG